MSTAPAIGGPRICLVAGFQNRRIKIGSAVPDRPIAVDRRLPNLTLSRGWLANLTQST